MVEPFSEIGMIAQAYAIQPVMDQPSRPSCDPLMLPDHLQGHLMTWKSHREASWRVPCCSLWIFFPYRFLP